MLGFQEGLRCRHVGDWEGPSLCFQINSLAPSTWHTLEKTVLGQLGSPGTPGPTPEGELSQRLEVEKLWVSQQPGDPVGAKRPALRLHLTVRDPDPFSVLLYQSLLGTLPFQIAAGDASYSPGERDLREPRRSGKSGLDPSKWNGFKTTPTNNENIQNP